MEERQTSVGLTEGGIVRETTQTRGIGIEATQWQPGQSGNPSGRPKKLHITDAIRLELEQPGPDGMTNDAAIARKLVEMARGGNLEAIREIADRTEGKARQRTELSGPEGAALPFEIPETREALERRISELLGEHQPTPES
jgi:hypothetical protein